MRDEQTLNLQRNRAISIIEGDSQPKSARFVKTRGAEKVFDKKAYDRAMKLPGFKGYVANIPTAIVSAREVIGRHHELWNVEQSFRMSETDLDASTMFHRSRDAIEAHLTVVFTALGVARFMRDATGASLKKIITTLSPLQEFTGVIGDKEIAFAPDITPAAREVLDALPTSR